MRNLSTNSNKTLERNKSLRKLCMIALSTSAIISMPSGMAQATPFSSWTVVVNNSDIAPGTETDTFFSYNPPSINDAGQVIFRARAKAGHSGKGHGESESEIESSTNLEIAKTSSTSSGNGNKGSGENGGSGNGNGSGGEGTNGGSGGSGHSGGSGNKPVSGIFSRNMSIIGAPIEAIAVRDETVPSPNNIGDSSTFNEFPSFPRIDASSSMLAFRAQSQPSWKAEDTSGTSGIYFNTGKNSLATGIRNIEDSTTFSHYTVPDTNIRFDQFPGAPSPTGNLITFKGNWTDSKGGQTGIFYRNVIDKDAEGKPLPVIKIAARGDAIPEDAVPVNMGPKTFGSTAPPSAAAGKVVFTGLDNEDLQKAGGIFMADLKPNAQLTTVAGFNTTVPNHGTSTLTTFGEALSFDGRYVGFWAGWGTNTFQKTVSCGSDGNKELLGICHAKSDLDDQGNRTGKYTFDVIENQGIFLADTLEQELYLVAETGDLFKDFLFYNFSGDPLCKGEGPRWRSSAFLAVDDNNIVFKASTGADDEHGLYGALNVTNQFSYNNLFTILTTGMDGGILDPMAKGLPIVSLGIERDGLRNGHLAIAASMTDGQDSWAGLYTTPVPEPGTITLFAIGLGGLGFWYRKKS